MNETLHPASPSDLVWPNSAHPLRVADMSTPPGSEKPVPAAVGMPESATPGAGHSIDRPAVNVMDAMRPRSAGVATAGQTPRTPSDALRETRDATVEGMRTTVRNHPLVAVAAALALGAVFTRITR